MINIATKNIAPRVAVVTGANKGIGFFIALQLGMSGLFTHVVLACRDAQRGAAALQQLDSKTPLETTEYFFVPLELGNSDSHSRFAKQMKEEFGKVDVLVNNAAMAFKNADPTPFADQCTPTLNINYRGTVDFTEQMLPLVRLGKDPRIVNVASMSGYLRQLKSKELRNKFTSPKLTIPELNQLVDDYETRAKEGTHKRYGWGNSNYGLSKLAVIAATNVWARENPMIRINSCCPGYRRTDMTSQAATAGDPAEGARNAVLPATMENAPTGEFFQNFRISEW